MIKNDRLKVKRKVPNLNSLQAAICNVALFKTMKQKQFRDTIFISYSQQGVILQAQNQYQWNKANQFIANFIRLKKIQILTFGYQREQYDILINGELKEYTKRLKEKGYDDPYPYVNLIHYQRLRKSCQFMNKAKYNEPLVQWEKKNKQTPNFAYLVVEPRERFEEIKGTLLGMLKGENTPLINFDFSLPMFLYIYYNSQQSPALQALYQKKQLQLRNQDSTVHMTIYADIELFPKKLLVKKFFKNLHRLRYQIIKQDQIRRMLDLVKQLIRPSMVDEMNDDFVEKYGESYCFVVCDGKDEKEMERQLEEINSRPQDREFIQKEIGKYRMCEFEEVVFVEVIGKVQKEPEPIFSDEELSEQQAPQPNPKPLHIALINKCQFLLQQFTLSSTSQLSDFLLYLQQYTRSANSSLLRFYGICISTTHYYTILDYKPRSLYSVQQNTQLIDQIQVSSIILQIMYSVNIMHNLSLPRCLGVLSSKQVFIPYGMILPYLYDFDNCTVKEDVRVIGKEWRRLMVNPSEEIEELIQMMVCEDPYERIDLEGAIGKLEAIIL